MADAVLLAQCQSIVAQSGRFCAERSMRGIVHRGLDMLHGRDACTGAARDLWRQPVPQIRTATFADHRLND
jgi:hypothetical protein